MGVRMHVIINGEPLEEVYCFEYLRSQVAADGGCERDVVHKINQGLRAYGALKSVLSNRGFGIKAKKCLYEREYNCTNRVVRSRSMRYEKC